MRILCIVVCVCTIAISAQFEEMPMEGSPPAEVPSRNTVYIHPIMLAKITPIKKIIPFFFHLTYERTLIKQTAATGSFLFTVAEGKNGDKETINFQNFEFGLGMRRFKDAEKSDFGFFAQPYFIVGYIKQRYSTIYEDEINDGAIKLGMSGYIGYKIKFDKISLFVDAGVGYQNVKLPQHSDDIPIPKFAQTALIYDGNFGLGYSF